MAYSLKASLVRQLGMAVAIVGLIFVQNLAHNCLRH